MPEPTILWFRRDLRIDDHPALVLAARTGPVLPIFIFEDRLLRLPTMGAGRVWWLLQALKSLGASLSDLGAPLHVLRGDPAELLPRLCRDIGARGVIAHRDYLPLGRENERQVEAALADNGHALRLVHGLLVHAPGTIGIEGRAYRIFPPFWKRWRSLDDPAPERAPASLQTTVTEPPPALPSLQSLGPPDPPPGVTSAEPGETAAARLLASFLAERLSRYAEERNRPQGSGGSRLSPYFRYGIIGPRTFLAAVRRAAQEADADPTPLLRELAFREFYAHLASEWRGPTLTRDARPDERARFDAWREGRTGYPFVDAAMREMAATGWISNRARLIVSSFLIHDLELDHRLGERHFLRALVDADPSSNHGNWRWSAGIGPDAPPPWRSLNATVQAKRHDPDGAYTRRWVPEVARLPDRYVHEPWTAPSDVQRDAGCLLGTDYPTPIVPPRVGKGRARSAPAAEPVQGPLDLQVE